MCPRSVAAATLCLSLALASCDSTRSTGVEPGGPTDPEVAELVERGRDLFFDETFGGNGRTCGTCHPEPTLVLTPADIDELPPDDPFFAATLDFHPDSAQKGLVRYPLGGTSLLEPEMVVFRAIPSIVKVETTAPFTSDGRAARLQDQAAEAVLLHLLDGAVDRPGERMPTDDELDAIAAFQESLGAAPRRAMPRDEADEVALGRSLFMGRAACSVCHVPPDFTDNDFHNIVAGTEGAPPTDPGRCRVEPSLADCWSGTAFNTTQLGGLRHSAPFFHDNSQPTLCAVVEFYDSPTFLNSPAALRLGIAPLGLSDADIDALVAFLETL